MEYIDNYRVLVGSHPYKMDYQNNEFTGHWLSKMVFDPVVKKYKENKPVTVETTDIMEKFLAKNQQNIHTHEVDIFDVRSEFAHVKREIYDAFFFPDCGGDWYYCQDLNSTIGVFGNQLNIRHKVIINMAQNHPEKFKQYIRGMIATLCNLVKPGGVLWLSKFIAIDSVFSTTVLEYLQHADGTIVDTTDIITELGCTNYLFIKA